MWAIDAGWVALTPSLPRVWAANTVHLSGPASYERALELTDEHMRDLPHRQLTIEHEPTAKQLGSRFVADGWTVDRDVVMALARPPDRQAGAAGVRECDGQLISRLMAQWVSERPSIEPDEVDQVVEFTRREARARDACELGIVGDDGAAVAMTRMYSDGTTAQLENVYTSPAWRERGYSRALIGRAVELADAAGHELVFLCADDDGWPKQLYAKLGFDPIGQLTRFHREAG
jgi:GNAT superfamily N-acetyltransferase